MPHLENMEGILPLGGKGKQDERTTHQLRTVCCQQEEQCKI